jgi:hypothetical protein
MKPLTHLTGHTAQMGAHTGDIDRDIRMADRARVEEGGDQGELVELPFERKWG